MTLPGVAFLDHTADLGMDVAADSLQDLLQRAALGMLVLLRGEEERSPEPSQPSEPPEPPAFDIDMVAESAVDLLAAWLREILFLHEVRHLDFVRAELDLGRPDPDAGRPAPDDGPQRARGTIFLRPGGHAVREIKGVTYHELVATRLADGSWRARVIFDV
jgi:SHS2 domain-containing protein